jgi:hypothetical protein
MNIAKYNRAIREGRWGLIADSICVVGPTFASEEHPVGQMFNGATRCTSVVQTRITIPIYIDWDADPSTFDVLDTGRPRSAYQFLDGAQARARVSGARVCLWYQRRFDSPLASGMAQAFDVHELTSEAQRLAAAFDAVLPAARAVYEYTSIPLSICLGAFAIAHEQGLGSAVEAFAEAVKDPAGLPIDNPARALSDRFRSIHHRTARRPPHDDWSLLVRAFNLHLEGKSIIKLFPTQVWPRVGESSVDFDRRRSTSKKAVYREESRGGQAKPQV